MKRFLLGLMIAAIGATGANAQILWKVSGNGTKSASYLFGTHHLAPLSMLDSVKGFAPALLAVDAVAGEVDMKDMQAKTQQLMGYMLAPADSILSSVLSKAQMDSLTQITTRYMGPQFTAEQFIAFKPAAVATQLALFESMATMEPAQAQALAAGQQLDSEVQNRAIAANKPILAFETAEQQMGILMGAPIADQSLQLMEAIRQCIDGKSAENAKKLTDAYISQNLDAIADLMLESEDMSEAEMQRLIYDRNLAWAAKMTEEILPSRSVLVAVGAGHLPGRQGLIELLRAAGYTVEPAK